MAFNMRATKNPMPTQAPEVRRHNFDEVAIGYTEGGKVQTQLKAKVNDFIKARRSLVPI